MPQRCASSILASTRPLRALVRFIWASLRFTHTFVRSPFVATSAATSSSTSWVSVSSRAAYCSASSFLCFTLTTCQYASSTPVSISSFFLSYSSPDSSFSSAALLCSAHSLPPMKTGCVTVNAPAVTFLVSVASTLASRSAMRLPTRGTPSMRSCSSLLSRSTLFSIHR